MPGILDFLRNGIMLLLGGTFGLLHAILSIAGLLMIFVAVISWGVSSILGSYSRAPISLLVGGVVMCSIFGFSYGLNYFDIII